MRAAQRASLLRSEPRMLGCACAVAFILLASAATAHAECAWVLWAASHA